MSSSKVLPVNKHSNYGRSPLIDQTSNLNLDETSTMNSTLASASTSASPSGSDVPLQGSSVEMVRIRSDTLRSLDGSPVFLKPSHQAPVPPSSVPNPSDLSATFLEERNPEDREEERAELPQFKDQVELIIQTDSLTSSSVKNGLSNAINEEGRKPLSKKGVTASSPDLGVLARNSKGSMPSIANRRSFLQPSDEPSLPTRSTLSSPIAAVASSSTSSLSSSLPKPNRSMSDIRPMSRVAVSPQPDLARISSLSGRTTNSHNSRSQFPLSNNPRTKDPNKLSTRQLGVGQMKANGGVEHLKTPHGAKPKVEGLDRESSPGRSFRSKAKNALSRFFNSSPSGFSNGGVGSSGLEPAVTKGQPIRTLPGPKERSQPEGDLLFSDNKSVKSFESDSTDRFTSRRLSEASVTTNGEAPNMEAGGSRSSVDFTTSTNRLEKERSFVVVSGKKHNRTLSDTTPSPLTSFIEVISQPSVGVVDQSSLDLTPTDTRSKVEEETSPLPSTKTSSSESRSSTPTGDETIVQDGDLTFLADDHSSDSLSRSTSPTGPTGNHRKGSLSVGEISGIGTWECDLEGLLDGIAKKGGQHSPLKLRHGGNTRESPLVDSSKDFTGRVEHSIKKSPVDSQSMESTAGPVLGPPIESFILSNSQDHLSPKPANHMIRSISEPHKELKLDVESGSKSIKGVEVSSHIIDSPRKNLSSPSFSTTRLTSPSPPSSISLDGSTPAYNFGRSISPTSIAPTGDHISSISNQQAQPVNALDVQNTIRLIPSSPSPVLPRLPHDGLPSSDGIDAGQRELHGLGLGVDNADGDSQEVKIEKLKGTDEIDIQEILKSGHENGHEYQGIRDEAGEAVDKILRKDLGFKWVQTNRIAEFLGGRDPINVAAASLYMESFEFTGMKLDQAIRKLTSELYFKAETQELDRIIIAFCERYMECNPDTLFGSVDVLHQVAYSLLLLNTDLHVADQDRKMTRNQFVENTMSSIRTDILSFGQSKISFRSSSPDPPISDESAVNIQTQDVFDDASGPSDRISIRSKKSSRTPNGSHSLINAIPSTPEARSNPPLDSVHQPSSQSAISTAMSFGSSASSPLVGTPVGSVSYDPRVSRMSISGLGVSNSSASVLGSMFSKSWSHEMESTLKDLYNSVKSQEIIQPLHTTSDHERLSGSLSPTSPEMMTRNQSVRSQSSSASRLNSLKRGSIRGFTSLTGGLGNLGSPYSSNNSSGRLSPTLSVATSMGEGYNDSIYQSNPSMGFVSNLSHTIIKEHDAESVHSSVSASTIGEILDEELALLGSPWAKEGLVTRKYYMDSGGRRSKDKSWRSLFAVVQKGSFKTFTFESPGNSANDKTVGGGNWLANATIVDEFSLSHSLSKTLPAPGYNRHRPFVFVISLPSGAQTYFQVGTDTLTEEWVSTCNYWAARVSKEPLTGGVSNMDYGWGRPSFGNNSESESVLSTKRQSSLISNGHAAHVNEWKPPSQPLYPSRHDEESQLEALRKYLTKLDEDIAEHKTAESSLLSPRHFQGSRAHDNYRRKKEFLKEEHQKYTTYITSLEAGLVARLSKKGELRLNHTLEKASR